MTSVDTLFGWRLLSSSDRPIEDHPCNPASSLTAPGTRLSDHGSPEPHPIFQSSIRSPHTCHTPPTRSRAPRTAATAMPIVGATHRRYSLADIAKRPPRSVAVLPHSSDCTSNKSHYAHAGTLTTLLAATSVLLVRLAPVVCARPPPTHKRATISLYKSTLGLVPTSTLQAPVLVS